jgi:hypothetical protein
MKGAVMTKTPEGVKTMSRLEALSAFCASILSLVRPKRQWHTESSYTGCTSPRAASSFDMLIETDIRQGSHDILP